MFRLLGPYFVVTEDSHGRFFPLGGSNMEASSCVRQEMGEDGIRAHRMTRELSENSEGWSSLRRKAVVMVAV